MITAETANVGYVTNPGSHTLQWGRGLITAETAQLSVSSRGSNVLQWGRGLITAETASVQATVDGQEQTLQWGRGLITAETCCCGTVTSTPKGFNGAAV